MNVFINYNKRNIFSTQLELTGSSLAVSVWKGQNENTDTFDLDQIVSQYAEDHGCIALGVSEKGFAWEETTRISYLYRMPLNRSFSSVYVSGSAVKDDGSQGGSHNVASPAWVLGLSGYTPLLFILTPHKGCALGDCTLIWKAIDGQPDKARFINDGQDQASAPVLSSVKQHMAAWLPITLTGSDNIAADGAAQYTIGCDVPADIHITASCGTINRSIARSGQTLLVDARGLVSGDEIEIKLGYKWWPGASKKVVAIQ